MILASAVRMAQPLGNLLQPHCGVTRNLHYLRMPGDEPQIPAITGRFKVCFAEPSEASVDPGRGPVSMACCGTGSTFEAAALPALAEMLERISAASFHPDCFTLASAHELGELALDLTGLPVCSAAELQHPKCRLVRPDPDAKIHWTKGIDLHCGKDVFLPAVMVHTHLSTLPAERFWLQCTSGCAAHISYEKAVASAIFELLERDAISIVWLQQMALPRIEVDVIPSELMPHWKSYESSSRHLEFHFYNATNDLGVPIVYALRRSAQDAEVSTMVACAAADRIETALTKALRDLTVSRQGFRTIREHPDSWHDFHATHHGASLMSRAEVGSAFDFLLNSAQSQKLSTLLALRPTEQTLDLKSLIQALKKARMRAYVADLTGEEARSVGFRVVRVLVPALQPISFSYAARFLANPRLYELPQRLGFPAHSEPEINPWPQPFY